MKKNKNLLIRSYLIIFASIFFMNCIVPDNNKSTDHSYMIAVVDIYSYGEHKSNIRLIDSGSNNDYTAENSQGIQGGIFKDGNLYFAYDDNYTDSSTHQKSYLIQIDKNGNEKKIDIGNDYATQEMIDGDDGVIYLAGQIELPLAKKALMRELPASKILRINPDTSEASDFSTFFGFSGGVCASFFQKIDGAKPIFLFLDFLLRALRDCLKSLHTQKLESLRQAAWLRKKQ